MYQLTPPTAALQNLTITDSPSLLPTTALEDLHVKPSRKLPREESFRRAHLTALTRQWYGPPKASRSPIPSPRPSDINVSPEERLNQLRLHASNRESFNSLRLSYVRRRIIGELSEMAKSKPEHREGLELAKSYVERRENKKDVLSIIESYYHLSK